MADARQSKKRKRDENESKTVLQVSDGSAGTGPVVVTFPALEPPKKTPFKIYSKQTNVTGTSAGRGDDAKHIIAGETTTIDLYTGSVDLNPNSQYLIGIRDKKSNKILLRNAPLHVLARDVKALKSLEPFAETVQEERLAAKNQLGEAFGSKKAKQAIKAMERNKVDVSAMENVVGHIQGSIEAGTVALPSRDEAEAVANENRPIPRFNINASSPDEVYALHDIVSEVELDSIIISRLLAAPEDAKVSYLPYQRSQWINNHLASEFKIPKPNKTKLKILYYISCMFLFRTINKHGDRESLQKKMTSVPNEVIDGLLDRFTERSRNNTKPELTTESKTRLLTYMFALCLRLDDYATDPAVLASDLSLNPANVPKYFKQLGCKVEALTAAERARRGLGPQLANETKYCVLRVPLEFPKALHRRR